MLSSRRTFGANIELQHDQLRDLVSISNGIVFPESRSLCRSFENGLTALVAPLPVSPHCIGASADMVLCGGISAGEGIVVNVAKTTEMCTVGRGLVNAVGFIDSTVGFACSNDHSIYFADLSRGWVNISSVSENSPPNSAHISSNGKMLAVCGDGRGVRIYGGSGSDWQLLRNFRTEETADVGTSVSFDDTSNLLAGAFQSGEVYVWDIRAANRPLSTIKTVPNLHRSSPTPFRVAKFADSGQDLLFASEESGAVHVLDLRNMVQHVVLLDKNLTTKDYCEIKELPQSLDGIVGLDTSGDLLVVATTNKIIEATINQRNVFPVMDWR